MAQKMNVALLGLVENMSYIECSDCGKKLYPFGQGKTELMAQKYELPMLGVLPLETLISSLGDQGKIEEATSFERLKLDFIVNKK